MRITTIYKDYGYKWYGVIPPDTNPIALLTDLMNNGIGWEIDYESESDLQEQIRWACADLVARITRALTQGRFVRFMGKDYHAQNHTEVVSVLKDFCREIGRQSGRMSVLADDEQGLEIGLFSRD